ncbi:MAG: HepT-like ribonuclease domain-containing protein [Methanoregula sp.]|jgi:uncharacterized protein with HEPN domain|uniref:HepT-like ribonuclease domain-containing protein n=1 Tax=Methanoregula sp. TaxID=2052170 RepID=UPI003D130544
MSGRNTLELIHGILTEITKVSRLIEGYQYEDFYRDEQTYAMVTGCIRNLDLMAHQMPTIIQVKYALLPWKELAALEEEVAHADTVTRPGVIWRICTETLPRIQPLVENLIEELEK